jgi:hypothetical protein
VDYNTDFRIPQANLHAVMVPAFVTVHTTEGNFPGDRAYLANHPLGYGAHIYIDPEGNAYQMAPFDRLVYHCGVDDSKGERTNRPDLWAVWPHDENNGAIGIEISAAYRKEVNERQRATLVLVLADLHRRFGIKLDRLHIVGHKELKNTKIDPMNLDLDAVVKDVLRLSGPPQTGGRLYTQTKQSVAGPFLDYFDAHGGVAMFGYPLTAVEGYQGVEGLWVQYFENVRLEWRETTQKVSIGAVAREYLRSLGRL